MNEPLPNDIDALKALLLAEREQRHATHEQFSSTIQSLQKKLSSQEQFIAQLLKRLSGKKRERFDPDQLTFFDLEELESLDREIAAQEGSTEETPPVTSSKRNATPHGRRRLPDNLPREQRRYELSEQERACPACQTQRVEIGQETSEQLEVIPQQLRVIEHVRVKYACPCCEQRVAIASKPPQPIEKGLAGPGLLAMTVLAKYGDHSPLYRLEDILSRFGVIIRRSTLCDWTAAAADVLEPIHQRMRESILLSKVVHTDDTHVPLIDPLLGKTRTARFWAYIGDRQSPYVVFDFTESRNRDGPRQFLSGFTGYLQADAYGGYDGIYQPGGATEVACWAHARRYWHEARTTDAKRAHHALGVIARLYKLEELFASLSSSDRATARQQRAEPILNEFRSWMDAEQGKLLPKSPIGKALVYTMNQWDALVRYTTDGDLCIDNNLSERMVKTCAIGRKNWLFVATPAGGHRAAILLSIIASCKHNSVEPFAYLRDLFTRLPSQPRLPGQPADLDAFLPDRWLADHPEHSWRIDDLRRAERKAKRLRRNEGR